MKKGFTLIELLVVISIISLLSSVALGTLSTTRARAENTKRNGVILQYEKALALYAANHGGEFPAPTDNPNNPIACLGDYPGGTCGRNDQVSVSSSLKSDLSPYLQGFPPVSTIPVTFLNNPDPWVGAIYVGCDTSNPLNDCFKPYIFWYLQGANESCAPGIAIPTGFDPSTQQNVGEDPEATGCLFMPRI
jgi:prepilin-type N-terminal cleavage/methylation domain-containing protein